VKRRTCPGTPSLSEPTSAWKRAARNSHELYLLIACLLAGAVGLTVPSSHGRAITASFPGWVQIGWYVGLLAGACLSMFGLIRGNLTGALLERAGQLALAGFSTAYACGLVIYAGWPAAPTALITAAFGGACLARSYEIKSSLKATRMELAKAARGEP
jgi:hypothetical protein